MSIMAWSDDWCNMWAGTVWKSLLVFQGHSKLRVIYQKKKTYCIHRLCSQKIKSTRQGHCERDNEVKVGRSLYSEKLQSDSWLSQTEASLNKPTRRAFISYFWQKKQKATKCLLWWIPNLCHTKQFSARWQLILFSFLFF